MKWIVFVMAAVLLVLHQDFWNFNDDFQHVAFGVLPVGLWYHALYCVGCSLIMYLLVKYAWPSHLETYEELPSNSTDEHGHGGH